MAQSQVGQSTAGTSNSMHSNDAAARPVPSSSNGRSQPMNTTVQFQKATVNTATITAAFALPGLGRGSMSAKPPS